MLKEVIPRFSEPPLNTINQNDKLSPMRVQLRRALH